MPTVDLATLPANAQQELIDFYEFLQEKYAGRVTNPATSELQDQSAQVDFKAFIMSIPKVDGMEFERQKDYPKDIEL